MNVFMCTIFHSYRKKYIFFLEIDKDNKHVKLLKYFIKNRSCITRQKFIFYRYTYI